MDKRSLSERDICTKFITPALRKAGWDEMSQIREEVRSPKAGSSCGANWSRADGGNAPTTSRNLRTDHTIRRHLCGGTCHRPAKTISAASPRACRGAKLSTISSNPPQSGGAIGHPQVANRHVQTRYSLLHDHRLISA